jgi:hypothetical protein
MDWRHMGELQAAIEANGLTLLNVCVWNKTNGGMGSLYRSKHELVFIAKKARRRTRTTSSSASTAATGPTSGTMLASTRSGRPGWPTWRIIHRLSRPRWSPTRSETSACPARSCWTRSWARGRPSSRLSAPSGGYGIEIAPGYVDVAIRRWQAMTGKEAVLEITGQTFAELSDERAGLSSQDVASTRSDAEPATADS